MNKFYRLMTKYFPWYDYDYLQRVVDDKNKAITEQQHLINTLYERLTIIIRNDGNKLLLRKSLRTYQWLKKMYMEDDELPKYAFPLMAITKDDIQVQEGCHDALVVYLYDTYQLRIEGV